MPFLNQAFVDGAHVVARVVEHQIRQATTTAVSSAISSTPTGMSSTADPSSTATGNPNNDKNKDNSGSSTSPLLFFVALGFGVVFTNLWIIVGVKYCFRYNARNRVVARLDENGDPIDLQNMPARPHRRRREKKLMTMDEVNEKFPMVKYKTWVLDRKKDGLPTAGGISAPPSRANSIRSVEGIVPEEPRPSADSIPRHAPEAEPNAQTETIPTHADEQKPTKDEQKPATEHSPDDTPNATAVVGANDSATANEAPGVTTQTEDSQPKDTRRESEDDEEDDDDHVNPALDAEMMGSSGDTCAICIDTLEDDDDVRGLTCGHAFHAVCLDPWLTNRRACCPLCKADYYTPKVRPPAPEGEARDPNATTPVDPARNNERMNYPRQPARSFAWSHFRDAPRHLFIGRFDEMSGENSQINRLYTQARRQNSMPQAQRPEESSGNFMGRFRNRFPPFILDRVTRRNRNDERVSGARGVGGRSNGNVTTTATAPPTTITPSQLEAGVQPPSTTQPN
ncbi:hypothetical protein GGR50DRAFT_461710 [Xylaria sp. CBS 124048]|nr:hypothetical protein GGR50DRAFT_461710 [Xylaria sp. CBS 124048]